MTEAAAPTGQTIPSATRPLAPEAAAGPLHRTARVGAWQVAGWVAVLAGGLAAAVWDGLTGTLAGLSGATPPVAYSSVALLVLALGCELVDATIGMGYGTTLTPVLLVLGFPAGQVVPAALLSQLLANVSVAFFHHRAGNYDFWKDHRARTAALLMGGIGLGVSAATMLAAVKVDDRHLRIGITVMVIAIGAFMLVVRRLELKLRMRNVAVLAAIAAFNKAFSGGGYGPLVAGGQVLVGMPVKAAVATTAIAEAMVCVAAVAAYYAAGRVIPLYLALPLILGALLSTPLSALTLRRLPAGVVERVMALAIIALGIWALVQGKGI